MIADKIAADALAKEAAEFSRQADARAMNATERCRWNGTSTVEGHSRRISDAATAATDARRTEPAASQPASCSAKRSDSAHAQACAAKAPQNTQIVSGDASMQHAMCDACERTSTRGLP
jgi:hypothetical protein